MSALRAIVIVVLLFAVVGVVIKITQNKQPPKVLDEYYTVSFNVGDYGENIESIRVKEGEKLSLPVPKCKYVTNGVDFETGKSVCLDDYAFTGWYLDDIRITEENIYPFDKNVTLVAKWQSLWTINF